MGETRTVTITKEGGPPPPPKKQDAGKSRKVVKRRPDLSKKPKFGILKRGKTARSKPRFQAVRDPTSAPPLRILTHKGEKTRRNNIEEEAKKMPIHKIRETLRRNKLDIKSKDEKLAREVFINAKGAGMISDA